MVLISTVLNRCLSKLHLLRQGVIYELNGPDGSDTKKLLKVRLAALAASCPVLQHYL